VVAPFIVPRAPCRPTIRPPMRFLCVHGAGRFKVVRLITEYGAGMKVPDRGYALCADVPRPSADEQERRPRAPAKSGR